MYLESNRRAKLNYVHTSFYTIHTVTSSYVHVSFLKGFLLVWANTRYVNWALKPVLMCTKEITLYEGNGRFPPSLINGIDQITCCTVLPGSRSGWCGRGSEELPVISEPFCMSNHKWKNPARHLLSLGDAHRNSCGKTKQ